MVATVCLCCDQPQCGRFPSIPEGCLLTAWAESSAALGFLASQTLSVQTCAKWKQTQPRLLITIRLDLCPLFFSERHKMDDSSVRPLEKKRKNWEAGPVPSVQGTALLAWTIQVDTLVPPVIFQTYYFTRKVINYATDTSLVSSVPCGVNHRQILCH